MASRVRTRRGGGGGDAAAESDALPPISSAAAQMLSNPELLQIVASHLALTVEYERGQLRVKSCRPEDRARMSAAFGPWLSDYGDGECCVRTPTSAIVIGGNDYAAFCAASSAFRAAMAATAQERCHSLFPELLLNGVVLSSDLEWHHSLHARLRAQKVFSEKSFELQRPRPQLTFDMYTFHLCIYESDSRTGPAERGNLLFAGTAPLGSACPANRRTTRQSRGTKGVFRVENLLTRAQSFATPFVQDADYWYLFQPLESWEPSSDFAVNHYCDSIVTAFISRADGATTCMSLGPCRTEMYIPDDEEEPDEYTPGSQVW